MAAPQMVEEEHYDIDSVSEFPQFFDLILSGHNDHPPMNGRYKFDGQENGKPKYAKGYLNIFWTGGFWNCHFAKALADTPIPPLSGYTKGQGSCDI
jgi:hypothetical protein